MRRFVGIVLSGVVLGISACYEEGNSSYSPQLSQPNPVKADDDSIMDIVFTTTLEVFIEEAATRATKGLFDYIESQFHTSQVRQSERVSSAPQTIPSSLLADAQWGKFNFSEVEYYICSSAEHFEGDLSQVNNPEWSIASFYGFEPNTKSWCAVKIFQADNALGFVEDQLRQSYQSIESLTEPPENLLAVYRAHHADGRVAYIVISHTSDNMSYLWMEALSADANVALGMTSKLAGFNM